MTITIIIPYILCFAAVFIAIVTMYYVNKNTVEKLTSRYEDLYFEYIKLGNRVFELEQKGNKS